MSQLYNGNRYAPALVEGAPLARNVAAEDIAIGMGRVAQNVDAVSQGLLRHADESLKLEDALELRRVRAEAKTLMEERLNLRDGDPDALFREDGSPNKPAISELMKPFAARLDKVGRRLMNPDERAQMRFNANAAWVDLENGAYQMAEQASRARRDRKLGDGYKLAMETGDFEGAVMFARAGAEVGSWTPEQSELMAFEARRDGVRDELGALMMDNPDEAYDRLNSGLYDVYLPAAERARMRARLREGKKLARPKDIMDIYINNPEAARAKDKTPEFSGCFTAQECGWINAIAAGKGADVKREMEYAAIEEARAFDPKGDSERSRADFMRKWHEQFGLDKDFCSRQLTLAEKRRSRLSSPQIDVKQRLDNMESGGVLRNEETWKRIQENMPGVERIRRDFKALAGISDDDDDDRVKEKYLTYRMKSHNKELRGRIGELYDAWLDSDRGMEATPQEQAEQLRSFARQVTGRKDVGIGGYQELQQDVIAGSDAQQKRHAEWKRSRGKLIPYSNVVKEEPYMNASLGFDAERKDLPAGVLLPKSMLGDAKQEDVVMEITYDNKHIRRFRVVGTTDGNQPVMTYAVARDGGYELDRVYNVAARLRHGRTDELMAPMDRPIGASSVRGSLGITRETPPPAAADMLGGLAPYREAFIAAGNKYGIDPNFLMAIAANETGWGSSRVFQQQNNAMGVYDAGTGRSRTFSSVAESIDFMAGQLKKHYFDKGLTTIPRIGARYAPVGAANDPRGLNGGWVRGVTAAYDKLSGRSK